MPRPSGSRVVANVPNARALGAWAARRGSTQRGFAAVRTAANKQFSVTAGPPMRWTHLGLLVQAQAARLIAAASKGISAMKLSEVSSNQDLFGRLSRIIPNCGRSIVQAKLADRAAQFGIAATEGAPATRPRPARVAGMWARATAAPRACCSAVGVATPSNAAGNIAKRRAHLPNSLLRRREEPC